jgi:hypothetical protein
LIQHRPIAAIARLRIGDPAESGTRAAKLRANAASIPPAAPRRNVSESCVAVFRPVFRSLGPKLGPENAARAGGLPGRFSNLRGLAMIV